MSCDLTLSYTFWAPGMDAPESLTKTITREAGPALRREIDLYTSDKHGHAEWNAYDVTIQSTVGDPISIKVESPRLVDNGDDTYTYKGTINLPKLDDTCAMCLPKSRKRIELYNIDKYQPYFHAPLVDRVEGDAEEIILSADGRERSASYNEPGSITINATGGVWTRFDKVVKLEQQIHKIIPLSEDTVTYDYDVTTRTSGGATGGGFSNAGSIDFKDTANHLTCGDVATLNNATAFTVSCWVYLTDADKAGNQAIFSVGPSGDKQIRVFKGSNQEIRLDIKNETGGTILSSSNLNTITIDGWSHVVVTFNNGVGKIYINGDLKITSTSGYFPNNTYTYGDTDDTFNIGRLGYLNQQHWKGLIDELAIWSDVLSDEDVSKLYNNGDSPTDLSDADSYDTDRTDDLTHWWRMEEGEGSTVVNTANPETNDATLLNSAEFSTSTLGDVYDVYDPYTGILSPTCVYIFLETGSKPHGVTPPLVVQVGDTLNFERYDEEDNNLTESTYKRMLIFDTETTHAEQNSENPDWVMTWTPDTAGLYYYGSVDHESDDTEGEILVTDDGEAVIYRFNKKQFRSARGQVNVKISSSDNVYYTTDFRLIQSTDNEGTTNVTLDHGTFLSTDNSNTNATLGTYVSNDYIYITIQNVPQQAVVSGDITLLS